MKSITIKAETADDQRSLFELSIDEKVVGQHLTAVQVHILVGEILEKITFPTRSTRRAIDNGW